MRPLLLLTCRLPTCQRRFLICSRCFRNQKYCSAECSADGRRDSARLARRVYRAQPEIKAARRERARAAYWEKRLLADHTTSAQGPGVKVRGARGEPAVPRPTQRAPQRHVDGRFVPFIPSPRTDLPREPTPTVRCSMCGAPGAAVLFGPVRFRR